MDDRSFHRKLLLLLVIACISRLCMLRVQPIDSYANMWHKRGDEKYYSQIAHSIVGRYEFSENYEKAYRPPGYPAFLAVNLIVFGENSKTVQIVQNCLFLLAVILCVFSVYGLFGTNVALCSALLLIINPVWLFLPQEAVSETLFIALLALALYLFTLLIRNRRWNLAVLIGVIIGLSALVREIGVPIGMVLVVVTWYTLHRQGATRKGLGLVSLMVGGILFSILPWTIRNYVVFGRFVPISTNGTINFYIGNNPEATGEFHWKLPERAQEIWNTPSERGANEIEAMRLAGKEATAYMYTHPGRTIFLMFKKLWLLWKPAPIGGSHSTPQKLLKVFRAIFWVPYFVIGCYGLWLLRREPLGWTILGIVVAGSLVHMLTFSDLRFRAPYEFLLAIPSAYGLVKYAETSGLCARLGKRIVT